MAPVLVCLIGSVLLIGEVALAAGTPVRPSHDDEVVQRLGPRLGRVASTPEQAATQASKALAAARETADPRYLGSAQAALGRWWGDPSAPVDLQVLEASTLQARHEFVAARVVLERLLNKYPETPQAWLILANLHKLQGRYQQAAQACEKLTTGSAALYGLACRNEVLSHQGQIAQARAGFTGLLQERLNRSQRAWLYSLIAENEERGGAVQAAERAYQSSLSLEADGYTAVAAADHYLRHEKPHLALEVLREQPESDAVLLRRAHAQTRLGDRAADRVIQVLNERFTAADLRSDPLGAHARERAYLLLRLTSAGAQSGTQAMGRASAALSLALENLAQQNEFIDWQLAFEAAERAADRSALERLRQQLRSSGLRDERLQPWLDTRSAAR